MNQADLERLSSFSAVWQRVQGNADTQEVPQKQKDMITLLDGANYAWSGYAALANVSYGETRQKLIRLARETKTVFQQLQVQYFLQEGDTYTAGQTANFASYTSYNLRNLWQNTTNLAQICDGMPVDDCLTYGWGFSCIRETFLQHARTLEQLLLQSFQ